MHEEVEETFSEACSNKIDIEVAKSTLNNNNGYFTQLGGYDVAFSYEDSLKNGICRSLCT